MSKILKNKWGRRIIIAMSFVPLALIIAVLGFWSYFLEALDRLGVNIDEDRKDEY